MIIISVLAALSLRCLWLLGEQPTRQLDKSIWSSRDWFCMKL